MVEQERMKQAVRTRDQQIIQNLQSASTEAAAPSPLTPTTNEDR